MLLLNYNFVVSSCEFNYVVQFLVILYILLKVDLLMMVMVLYCYKEKDMQIKFGLKVNQLMRGLLKFYVSLVIEIIFY